MGNTCFPFAEESTYISVVEPRELELELAVCSLIICQVILMQLAILARVANLKAEKAGPLLLLLLVSGASGKWGGITYSLLLG